MPTQSNKRKAPATSATQEAKAESRAAFAEKFVEYLEKLDQLKKLKKLDQLDDLAKDVRAIKKVNRRGIVRVINLGCFCSQPSRIPAAEAWWLVFYR